MSDLHLAPPRESSRWPTLLIAAAVLAVIAGVVYFLLPASTAKVTITGVRTYSPHTVFDPLHKQGAMNILGQKSQTEDDLYVVLTVAIKDQFHKPVSVDAASATLTNPDDSVSEGSTVAHSDIQRLDSIFPDLATLTPHPLSYDDEVQPGQTIEKQIVVMFPGLNADAWRAKKTFTLTVSMHNQPPQTVLLH
jgi:hypothetical protein